MGSSLLNFLSFLHQASNLQQDLSERAWTSPERTVWIGNVKLGNSLRKEIGVSINNLYLDDQWNCTKCICYS